MLYLVGIEILSSWFAVSYWHQRWDLNVSPERDVLYTNSGYDLTEKKRSLMEIKLFKYRCVVSLRRPFQCCRLKTKALLHKANKKILSGNHFVRSHRVKFRVTVYWKDCQEMLKEGQSALPLPVLPKTGKWWCLWRWKTERVARLCSGGKRRGLQFSPGSSAAHSGNSPHVGIKQRSAWQSSRINR